MLGVRIAICGALCVSAAANAQPLDERAAIERALARETYRQLEEGRVSAAHGEVRAAATLPNPVVGVAREQSRQSGANASETSIEVSQRFDFSGRRGLRREAAETRLGATRLDQLAWRRTLVAQVRRTFADALARQQVVTARLEWVRRLDAATSTVQRLVKGGEQPGYALRRLERELLSARASHAAEDAERARARELLNGLVGDITGSVPLASGAPTPLPTLDSVKQGLGARPDLAALAARAEAFEREAQAAERQRIPEVTAGIGAKRVDERNFSDTGLLLSLSIPLPVFDRGDASAQIARGNARALRAEHTLAVARAEAELRGGWLQASGLHEAAASFRRDSTARSRDLARIAEQAYRAGEGSILELLDAYRSELEAETTALDLELRARLARIELEALSATVTYD
jgi:outer membrane protein, heavy metal efflux system